ncbi:hypothetical protein F5B21DRAFT_440191 [Xylaria acuta]|nr:hypothetical protein F5B21DRAFT_440191 [Xylaria acuta]
MAIPIPRLQDLHATIGDILSIPSLSSYSRALSLVEEVVKLVHSSPDADSPAALSLLRSCEVYRVRCEEAIHRLATEESTHEHRRYERASRGKHAKVRMGVNAKVERVRRRRRVGGAETRRVPGGTGKAN